jgi:uncharacterized protein (UPF0254 family)
MKNKDKTMKLGEFTAEVIEKLNLDITIGSGIYIGTSNILHMSRKHPYEFDNFFDKIPLIISSADYVRRRNNDGTIEYIKLFGKHLKLAIRIAGDGEYYTRSLYFVETNRIENLLKKGELKRLTKQ